MSNPPTKEQLEKLPKWASKWIESCENRALNAENALGAYLNSTTPSNIYTQRGLGRKCFIQDDRVVFVLPRGEITASLEDGFLDINGNYGNGKLMVRPWSSNVVHVEIAEDK